MENLKEKILGKYIIFYLFISLLFFIETFNLSYINLSSDQLNFLPIVEKKNDTNLYKNDLFLDNFNNVKYYTPFFINSIFILKKIFKSNVFFAFSILFFITTFLYYVCWHLFYFELFNNNSAALFFTFISKVILWPPGSEIWGLSSLWSFLPRSIFLALLPLSFYFIIKYYYSYSKIQLLFLSGLILGFISNFHPISGLHFGIVLTLSILINNFILKNHKNLFYQIVIFLISFLLGFIFFILNYYENILNSNNIDHNIFNQAIRIRISSIFFDPIKFISKISQNILLFILMTHFLFFFIIKKCIKRQKKFISLILIFSFLTIFFSLSSVYFENLIKKLFNLHFYISFQYIRNFKYILLSSFVLFSFFIECFYNKIFGNRKNIFYIFSTILLFLLSYISNYLCINSNDAIKFIVPFNKNSFSEKNTDLLDVLNWINKNTKLDDSFIGPEIIRIATKRSVVFDFKGASMLIEGNKEKYLNWHSRYLMLSNSDKKNIFQIYRSWNVNYVVTKEGFNNENLVYSNKTWYIYKL